MHFIFTLLSLKWDAVVGARITDTACPLVPYTDKTICSTEILKRGVCAERLQCLFSSQALNQYSAVSVFKASTMH